MPKCGIYKLCCFDVATKLIFRNGAHKSESDQIIHMTIRMKTAEMIAAKTGRTAHIYWDGRQEEYSSMKIRVRSPDIRAIRTTPM